MVNTNANRDKASTSCGRGARLSANVPDLQNSKQVLFFKCEGCGSVFTEDVPHEPPKEKQMQAHSNDGSWRRASTAPFDRTIELAVITSHGAHSLAFPCRRVLHGWLNAETDEPLHGFNPTHWREWHRQAYLGSLRFDCSPFYRTP